MKRRLLLAALAGAAVPASRAQSGNLVPVHGQLLSRSSGPVPGVTASLVHNRLGRSTPSVSDAYGRFGWSAIPVRPEPYYLEFYWGQKLIYRNALTVSAAVQLQPIVL